MAKNNNAKSDVKKKATAAASKPKQKREKGRFKEYFKGVRLEMKKVVWPTKKELWQYTGLVLVACGFFALAFWAIDTGFLAILKRLLGIAM
jgi:preprotein translocase subunit SecE